MKQRVNIQYSIDMEDLEPEVNRLINTAEAKIKKLHDDMDFPPNLLGLPTLTAVENLRMELANIDFMLADITRIVNAYVSYRSQQIAADAEAPQAEQQPPHQSHDDNISERMLSDQSDLLKKMENLRSAHKLSTQTNDRATQT